jgi:cephalosporin hydroxylase
MTEAVSLPWTCDLSAEALAPIQGGTLATRYKGVMFLKSPFDIALYTQLVDRLRPGTVIEIGARQGGSALWFADVMGNFGIPPRVVSLDLPEVVAEITVRDPRIVFLSGNALRLEDTLTPALLAGLPRPWLVIEDSAHLRETTLATLDFFHRHLQAGDYIVVEDGVIAFMGETYRDLDNGPMKGMEEFLARHAADYEVDRAICDFYGRNVTWNPNGWLRRR